MIEVPVLLKNDQDFSKDNEIFRVGVPFPKGLVTNNHTFSLVREGKEKVPCTHRVLASWPDGSLKWVLICFSLTIESKTELACAIEAMADDESGRNSSRPLQSSNNEFVAVLNGLHHSLNKQNLQFESRVQPSAEESLSSLSVELVSASGDKSNIVVQEISENYQPGSNSNSLRFKGKFAQNGCETGLRFDASVDVFNDASSVQLDFTIWNPAAATHKGGCWDLGDDGSVCFKSLMFRLMLNGNSEFQVRYSPSAPLRSIPNGLRLSQSGSSFGPNPGELTRLGNIHKGSDGVPPEVFNGYQELDPEGGLISQGLRLSPIVSVVGDDWGSRKGLSLSLKHFWQNFPKAIDFDSGAVLISMFPELEGERLHELQPGERKTHTLVLSFSGEEDSLRWVDAPSSFAIDPEWIAKCQILPFYDSDTAQDSLLQYINQAFSDIAGFEAKRKFADEYGWRNFGDVYADHETLYQKEGEEPYVSHYNNQYDAIYGFARQYLSSGDYRWYSLMDELASHVTDIDIYHTELDRVEYNNGLFWHTDHYLDAQTATHRTFTRHNDTSSTPNQTGGGPGSEHCYATGLMYHYFLTGNEKSKEAVYELAEWMTNIHDGAKSFLAQVLLAKNNELNKLKLLGKRRYASPYRYPFTRGTGNYISVLLDAFVLSDDRDYLARAEEVIRKSLHPGDDIALRNLDNIEDTWSYVVLLQSLAKYLWVKEVKGLLDVNYIFAKQSLLHYVDWMEQNESPYLSRSKELEFPNDTWVAQEIRKVSLLVSGAQYSQTNRDRYLKKAQEFVTYIEDSLSKSDEKYFSRVQILLLQNHGPHLWCNKKNGFEEFDRSAAGTFDLKMDFGQAPTLNLAKVSMMIVWKILKGLRFFKISAEKEWIRTRRS